MFLLSAEVFALVRQYMADEEYCQNPLLVWPGCRLATVEAFLNEEFSGQRPTPDSDFLALADLLLKYPNYGRAVKYLQQLAREGRIGAWFEVQELLQLLRL